MDTKLTLTTRIAAYVFVPVGLVLLLPVVLLFVVAYFLFVLIQGIREGFAIVRGQEADAEFVVPKPHFLETALARKALPKDS